MNDANRFRFRGRRVDNGKWVRGFYSQLIGPRNTCHYVLTGEADTGKGQPLTYQRRFRVDPATVGQSTGLTDKNGTEIFEGDVVVPYRFKKTPKRHGIPVVFKNGSFCLGVKKPLVPSVRPLYPAMQRATKANNEYVVIGSVHENPELLDRAEKETEAK